MKSLKRLRFFSWRPSSSVGMNDACCSRAYLEWSTGGVDEVSEAVEVLLSETFLLRLDERRLLQQSLP